MAKGKQTCKILKEIRKQIAAENDIKLVVEECTYQGDCLGTCPKCEAEVRYLERELEKRQRMGKAAVFAGMSLGTLFAATSCNHPVPEPLAGEVMHTPDSTEMPNDSISNDTIPSDAYLLEGDVLAPEPDTLEEVGETTDGYVVPWTDSDEPEAYMIVEEMPEFLGGEEKLMEYVSNSVQYPKEAKEKGVQGIVYVSFIVEPDGNITVVKVLRGIGHGCDEEAMRVVESMPKWNPGMHHGKPVRVSYTIPIVFYWPN